ncbi:MAG: hypothetical protein ACI92Z_001852 [Paracoccaceae bacterium]|jgi:hypothetical protein
MLKSGMRPSGPKDPGGAYDGQYVQDWEYVRGLGNLNDCNGAMLGGEYVYFVTDAYPFYPRCLYGTKITKSGDKNWAGILVNFRRFTKPVSVANMSSTAPLPHP